MNKWSEVVFSQHSGLLLFALLLYSQSPNTAAKQCYQDADERFHALDGKWRRSESTVEPPPYWNLSCPFEWSKYSCSHQSGKGKVEHALRSSELEFVPNSCSLPSIDARTLSEVLGPTGTVRFDGDSLMRQIFIAFACAIWTSSSVVANGDPAAMAQPRIAWAPNWPCHGTRNCVTGGPHSGFHGAKLSLPSGAIISYGKKLRDPPHDTTNSPPPQRPPQAARKEHASGRRFIIMGSPHGPKSDQTYIAMARKVMPLNKRAHDRVIYAIPGPQHFDGGKGVNNGAYDDKYLDEYFRKNGHNVGCRDWVNDTRGRGEWKMLRGAIGHGEKQGKILDGVVSLTGLDALGQTKVGAGVGSRGDCTHYCMPGPVDQIARALYSMILGDIASSSPSLSTSSPSVASSSTLSSSSFAQLSSNPKSSNATLELSEDTSMNLPALSTSSAKRHTKVLSSYEETQKNNPWEADRCLSFYGNNIVHSKPPPTNECFGLTGSYDKIRNEVQRAELVSKNISWPPRANGTAAQLFAAFDGRVPKSRCSKGGSGKSSAIIVNVLRRAIYIKNLKAGSSLISTKLDVPVAHVDECNGLDKKFRRQDFRFSLGSWKQKDRAANLLDDMCHLERKCATQGAFAEIQSIDLSDEIYDKYFVFSFVRNPFTRVVSIYNEIGGHGLEQALSGGDKLTKNVHYNTQTKLLTRGTKSGTRMRVDFVGHLETLSEDWARLAPAIHPRNRDLSPRERLALVLPHGNWTGPKRVKKVRSSAKVHKGGRDTKVFLPFSQTPWNQLHEIYVCRRYMQDMVCSDFDIPQSCIDFVELAVEL